MTQQFWINESLEFSFFVWLQCFNEAVLCLFVKNMGHTLLEQRTNIQFLVKLEKTATDIYKLKANTSGRVSKLERSKGRCHTKRSPWSSRMGGMA
jgi:hypothetical protein